MTPELEAYVKAARERGMSDDAIRSALLNMGWDMAVIAEALGSDAVVASEVPATAAIPPASSASANLSKKSWPKIAAITILVVLVLAGGGLAYAFFVKQKAVVPVEEALVPTSTPIEVETASSSAEKPTSTALAVSSAPKPDANGIIFSFSPVSGLLPLTATVTCDRPGSKVTVAVYIDDTTRLSNALTLTSDTRGGVPGIYDKKIQLPDLLQLQGAHKVYCVIQPSSASLATVQSMIAVHFQPDPPAGSPSSIQLPANDPDAIAAKALLTGLVRAIYSEDPAAIRSYLVSTDADEKLVKFPNEDLDSALSKIQTAVVLKEGVTLVVPVPAESFSYVLVQEGGSWKMSVDLSIKRALLGF